MILDEEEPDVLTVYDDNGGYGHPDHIQVHRVGMRAGELSAVPVVAQGTINRDWMARGLRDLVASGRDGAARCPAGRRDWGKPEAEITHRVEVVDVVDRKRASMRAHASQMGPDHLLLAMPEPMFARRHGRGVLHRGPAAQPGRDAGAVRRALHAVATPLTGSGQPAARLRQRVELRSPGSPAEHQIGQEAP